MGSTVIEVMMAVMLITIITFGALFYYGAALEQSQRNSEKDGSETSHQTPNIDRPAPRHSSSGSISNLESF
jgi:Tfp pilus assembly protein PilV